MRILVIGGGIAGMATAIALEQAGFDPLVLEQAPELAEIGSGIGMQANALRVLREPWRGRPRPRARACGSTTTSGGGWTAARRSSARRIRRGRSATAAFTSLCMHRADLLESLAQRVAPERVRLGCSSGSCRRSVPTAWSPCSRTARRCSGTSWSARTGCARPYERSCSASGRRASRVSPRGGGRSPPPTCRPGSSIRS